MWPQICFLSLIREEIFLFTEAVSFNSCVQITHGLLDVSKFNVLILLDSDLESLIIYLVHSYL